MLFSTSTPAVCAMASTISTPGITGKSGKWPWKNGSLSVTFLMPTMRSGFHFHDAVDQQKGVAMRQNRADLVDIQNGHGSRYYNSRGFDTLVCSRPRQPEIIALIRQFVECESPSDDPAAVNRFVELVSDTIAPYRARSRPSPAAGSGSNWSAR